MLGSGGNMHARADRLCNAAHREQNLAAEAECKANGITSRIPPDARAAKCRRIERSDIPAGKSFPPASSPAQICPTAPRPPLPETPYRP